MAKVITTIAAEDGMDFYDICSFKTENYIGIYNDTDASFTLIRRSYGTFAPTYLKSCDSLKELDDMVYDECKEHIKEVFEDGCYTILLSEEKPKEVKKRIVVDDNDWLSSL